MSINAGRSTNKKISVVFRPLILGESRIRARSLRIQGCKVKDIDAR